MTLRAAIFDIDGTLVDTNDAHVEAWREAFLAHGHDISAERLKPEIGKGGDQLVPALLGEEGERREGKALRDAHDKIYMRMTEERQFRVFPDVEELFTALRQRGLRIALATSSKMKFVQATQKSAHFDFCALADIVVTADDASASKPAPDLVQAALQKLELRGEQCCFVGDTAHDVEAAKHAGVGCIGLLCGGCSSHVAMRDSGAKSIWQDPTDLLKHLDTALSAWPPTPL